MLNRSNFRALRDDICKTLKGEASIQNFGLLGVELIKSDVNLNLALMCHVTLSAGDVFKGSNNRAFPCAYASPTSNGLLEKLIHFI